MADPWVGLMREVMPDWPEAGMQSDYDWLRRWRGAQQRAVQFRSVLKARIETFGDKCWEELSAVKCGCRCARLSVARRDVFEEGH